MKKLLGIALASAAAGLCLSALKKASDEQTVELSPVKRSSPNKKAILVVSFGTSYAQTREKTIGAIEEDFRSAFPEYTIRRAFTSKMIIFVGTVEGYPDLQTVMQEVAAIHASKVFLAPLMVVAGDHAINDLCGEDEDSWKSCFEQAGYQTEPILKGLGEYPAFRRIYLEHCVQCIQSLESEQ